MKNAQKTTCAVVLALLIAILLFVVLQRTEDVQDIESVHAEELTFSVYQTEEPPVATIFPQLEIPADTETNLDVLIPQFPLPEIPMHDQILQMSADMAAMDAELLTATTQDPQPSITYAGRYHCTGYDICYQCCGKTDGITASGAAAVVGTTCASNDFPFGTVLYIEGLGYRTVQDRGGMGHGAIDVLCYDHPSCYAITGYYDVYVVS